MTTTVLSVTIGALALAFLAYFLRTRDAAAATAASHRAQVEELRAEARGRLDRLTRESTAEQRVAHLGLVEDLLPGFDALDQAIEATGPMDSSTPMEASTPLEASTPMEASAPIDASMPMNASTPANAGTAADARAEVEVIHNGLLMARRELRRALERHEISAIGPELGDAFDPNIHEAVATLESELEPNRITDTLRVGYRHVDRVIRPAMVAVSAAKVPEAPASEGGDETGDEEMVLALDQEDVAAQSEDPSSGESATPEETAEEVAAVAALANES